MADAAGVAGVVDGGQGRAAADTDDEGDQQGLLLPAGKAGKLAPASALRDGRPITS
jgi:hypothetical protein